MASDRDTDESPAPGVFDTLLMPLRLPGRVVSDIETLTQAVVSLQTNSEQRLASVDDRAGGLLDGLKDLHGSVDEIKGTVNELEDERMPAFLEAIEKLQGSIDRIEAKVESLESLEATIEGKMEQLRGDLNERMLAVQHEVRAMQGPMSAMASDVAKIDDLLPNPNDGPLTRLKDTLSST